MRSVRLVARRREIQMISTTDGRYRGNFCSRSSNLKPISTYSRFVLAAISTAAACRIRCICPRFPPGQSRTLTIFGRVRSFHWHHSRIWRLSGETSLAYGLCSPGSSGKPAAITKFAIALGFPTFPLDKPRTIAYTCSMLVLQTLAFV